MNNLQTSSKKMLPFLENVKFINILGKKHKDCLAVKEKAVPVLQIYSAPELKFDV